MTARIVQVVTSCRECPNRHYYSGGVYECEKLQEKLPASCEIPAWCPLAIHPAADDSAQARASEAEDAAPKWMVCESRGPWAANGLRVRAREMRDAEKRCRSAFRKSFMGEPAKYIADAYGEAAAVFEARLATIDAARATQGDAGSRGETK